MTNKTTNKFSPEVRARTLGARASASQRDLAQGQRLFCPVGARPPLQAMISFIDYHRQVYGVEPICKVLPIAPSTYDAHVAKRANSEKLSARARRDMALEPEIVRVFKANFEVYGVKKIWHQMVRERFVIARCTVARLMRVMGRAGVIRGKSVKTTVQDKAVPAGSCEQELQGTGAERALGLRLYLRQHLGKLCLCGFPHRRLCSPHRRLACQPNAACRLCARCTRAGLA